MLTARAIYSLRGGFFVLRVCGWRCSGFCLQGAPPLRKKGSSGSLQVIEPKRCLSLAGLGLGVPVGGEGRNMFRTSG